MVTEAGSLVIYKWLTFVSMYVGYTLSVVNRKSFSFALPAILSSLHLTKDDIGLVSSSQNLAYTISKFFGGVLSDNVSAKKMFTVGLLFSGLLTVSLTAFQSAGWFALLWFLQGLVQGGGWPSCAKIMKQWFDESVFASAWSVLSSSMNVACAIGPIVMSLSLTVMPWRASFVLLGVSTVLVSLLCYVTIWNSPAEVGSSSVVSSNENKKEDRSHGKGRGTWQDMLRSPFMWLLCISYMSVFLGRTAMLDWAQLYLVQDLGHDPYVGSIFISSLEVGGIVGSIAAGLIADHLVVQSQRNDVCGSPRLTVATVFIVINILGLHALSFLVGSETSQILILLYGFFIGIGTYGPVSLYGVMAIEAAPTHLSGTSHAIVSLAANVGAIMAGLPFSYLAKVFEWRGSFIILETLLIVVLTTKILMRNVEYKMVPTKKKLQ